MLKESEGSSKTVADHPVAALLAFLRDPVYWLALSAGPVLWALMIWVANVEITTGLPLAALLMLVVVYPVLEEIVFRGALQGFLLSKMPQHCGLAGVSVANALTSVVFSAMHLFNHSALAAALVFLPSIVFGWARDKYGHLLGPILLHAFYNAGYFYLFG